MNMIADICAERDREIVAEAIAKATEEVLPKCSAGEWALVREALKIVSDHCNANISE